MSSVFEFADQAYLAPVTFLRCFHDMEAEVVVVGFICSLKGWKVFAEAAPRFDAVGSLAHLAVGLTSLMAFRLVCLVPLSYLVLP